ncbi:MAG: M15 family metallopeptidase [Clostridia bacterium]|nr:M15 family metallopeptidase [Clostridia bacterium]
MKKQNEKEGNSSRQLNNRGSLPRILMDPSHFVLVADFIPSVMQEIRYYTTYNFVGDRIDGYEEPCALLTVEAARALREVSNRMNVAGYRLKIFDAYRPAGAVRHFARWGLEDLDLRMKPFFYPDIEKHELFTRGYISSRSSHSRGSAVDLTLFDMSKGKEVDMGGPFDLFAPVSHPDFRGITEEQFENRMFLQKAMVNEGFEPYECEWWHFRLSDEPFPDRFFEFPVSSAYLKR